MPISGSTKQRWRTRWVVALAVALFATLTVAMPLSAANNNCRSFIRSAPAAFMNPPAPPLPVETQYP